MPIIGGGRVSGNVGMLGGNYAGYFEVGDAAGLAAAIATLARDPGALAALRRASDARRALFSPARERGALRKLVLGLLAANRR